LNKDAMKRTTNMNGPTTAFNPFSRLVTDTGKQTTGRQPVAPVVAPAVQVAPETAAGEPVQAHPISEATWLVPLESHRHDRHQWQIVRKPILCPTVAATP
jgi:hypothetical protein